MSILASPAFLQTPVPDTTSTCREIEDNATCSQSYLEEYFRRISKCGPIAVANTESGCRKNENGDLCRGVINSEFIRGNCSSRCTSECMSVLMQAGCCLNHTTGINQDFLTKCGMPIPLECPSTGAEIPNSLTNDSCNSIVLEEIVLETECDLVLMDPLLIRPWKENEECLDLAEDYLDYCSSRSEQHCLVEFNRTTRVQLLQEAENECSAVVSSNCSSQCRSSLEELSTTFGCCIHAVNTTRSGHGSSSALRYDLWKRCGITMPTRCMEEPTGGMEDPTGSTKDFTTVTVTTPPTSSTLFRRLDLVICLLALVLSFALTEWQITKSH